MVREAALLSPSEGKARFGPPYRRIGEGAFGEVVGAVDAASGAAVALKRVFVKGALAAPPAGGAESVARAASPSARVDAGSPQQQNALSQAHVSSDAAAPRWSGGFFSVAAFRELQCLRLLAPLPGSCEALAHPIEAGIARSADEDHDAGDEEIGRRHIVELRAYYVENGALVLVLERAAMDLATLLHSSRIAILPERIVRAVSRALLRALAHCHAHGVMHRDVKPGNILLGESGSIKLADFGIARPFVRRGSPGDSSPGGSGSDVDATNQVTSRWYRAPEILFGATHYGPSIDIWAAGCVIAELFNAAPLLPGASDIEQLSRVMAARGTPMEQVARAPGGASAARPTFVQPAPWLAAQQLPDFHKISFAPTPPPPVASLVPRAGADALALIDSLLALDPSRRPSASEALRHNFFTASAAVAATASDYEVAEVVRDALRSAEVADGAEAEARKHAAGAENGARRRLAPPKMETMESDSETVF